MRILFILLFITIQTFCPTYAKGQWTNVSGSPLFKGDLNAFVMNHIQYPPSAKKDSIEGRVVVSFAIDTLGNTFGHVVVRGIRDDLDQEALRVARLIKYDTPAMQKDKPMMVKVVIPVDFNLKYDQIIRNNSICDPLQSNANSPVLKKFSQRRINKMCKKMHLYKNDNLLYFPIILLIDENGKPISVQIQLENELSNSLVKYLRNESMKLEFIPTKKSGTNRNGCYILVFRFDKENRKWFYPEMLYF